MDSAEFLDLLGNDNRRRILKLLSQKPCYVTEISEYLGVSPKAVIDHLERLETAGLIESRTDERRRKYFSIARHVRLEVTVSPYEFGARSAYPTNSRFDVSSCRRVRLTLDSADSPERNPDAADNPERNPDAADDPDATLDVADGGLPGERPARSSDSHSSEAELAGESDPAEASSPTSAMAEPSLEAPRDAGNATNEVASLAHTLREFGQLDRELSLVHRWAEGRIAALREELIEKVPVGDPRLVSELLVDLAAEPRETETLYRRLDAPPDVVEEHLEALASEGLVQRDGRQWSLAE